MRRVAWFLLACLAGALAVVAWHSAPTDDPTELPEPDQDYDAGEDDLLHWLCSNDAACPDDPSELDGA